MYSIPILFVIFKRRDIALETFEQIKHLRPAKLYIAGDGARKGIMGEEKEVIDTRKAVLEGIDWDCEVETLFQDINLGCGMGVYTAINWFFEKEEEGVILEDDCIAHPTFFQYVEELLHRYKADERIGMIAGTNPIAQVDIHTSYCFSRYAACWGWATWRRAWRNMRIEMDFLQTSKKNILNNRGLYAKENKRWNYQLLMIKKKRVSAWDWQWYFSLAAQNQLCIFPSVNLISNIGNDNAATHTSRASIYLERKELSFPLIHPETVLPDFAFDHAFYKYENMFKERLKRTMPYRLKQIVKKFLR